MEEQHQAGNPGSNAGTQDFVGPGNTQNPDNLHPTDSSIAAPPRLPGIQSFFNLVDDANINTSHADVHQQRPSGLSIQYQAGLPPQTYQYAPVYPSSQPIHFEPYPQSNFFFDPPTAPISGPPPQTYQYAPVYPSSQPIHFQPLPQSNFFFGPPTAPVYPSSQPIHFQPHPQSNSFFDPPTAPISEPRLRPQPNTRSTTRRFCSPARMVGKKSGKAILREEGLARTDNNMDLSTWPQVNPINQKNYYTEYLKRDDQYLAFRTQREEDTNRLVQQARDRDRALAGVTIDGTPIETAEETIDDVPETHGSKIIVIHPGSQNLRIGLANDALPKTVPMCIARRAQANESEEEGAEPKPKRLKLDEANAAKPEKWFGDVFAKEYAAMTTELKQRMRMNKRRLLPNSKELVVNFNKKVYPETITEHNDPHRIDWTELPPNPAKAPLYFTGQAALRIPERSKPRYKLHWPFRHGTWFNERDYTDKKELWNDIVLIIEDAIKNELGLKNKKDWSQYSCVWIIPDLYERNYVYGALDILMREFGFRRACFLQESVSATFGAGYSISCIVDVGAQKTSICCVEDGMAVEESRMNLKFGGADVTEVFMRMMLHDYFPYEEINLLRRYDFLVAEELKQKFCTMNEAEITVSTYDFHLRAAGQDTRKYTFKTYDETMLAGMGYFRPQIFDHSDKLKRRRKIIDRSYDLYDGSPNDPSSHAQVIALQYAQQNFPSASTPPPPSSGAPAPTVIATPSKQKPFNLLSRLADVESTPTSSIAGSPGPEGTPQPGRASPGPGEKEQGSGQPDAVAEKIAIAEERDRILPIMPLDAAITQSITYGARGDDRKMRDFFGGIMVVGGGAKIPGFSTFLEEKLREMQPGFTKEILIGPPPRELDQQLVVWKGGSVFARLSSSGNDSWVYGKEYDMLGTKLLAQKMIWNW